MNKQVIVERQRVQRAATAEESTDAVGHVGQTDHTDAVGYVWDRATKKLSGLARHSGAAQ